MEFKKNTVNKIDIAFNYIKYIIWKKLNLIDKFQLIKNWEHIKKTFQ